MISVFEWEYNWRYYISHPWKWVAHLFRNIKYAWQRATKGYCLTDAWNMDDYLLHLIPNLLRELINDPAGAYPGSPPFDSREKWTSWLWEMVERFEKLQVDWSEKYNEWDSEYDRLLALHRFKEFVDDGIRIRYDDSEELEEVRKKWLARIKELREKQEMETRDVFAELAKYYYALWS